MQTTMLEEARRNGRELRDSIVFVTPGRDWSFGAVEKLANRIARGLGRRVIGRGARVAIPRKQSERCLSPTRDRDDREARTGARILNGSWSRVPATGSNKTR